MPSSQAKDDLKACVEQCADGKLTTVYRSAPGTFPDWVEVRWPQYASVNGARLYFRDYSTMPEYVKLQALGLDGKWVDLRTLKGANAYARSFTLPTTDCTRLRFIFGPSAYGRTEVRELEVTGEAPRLVLPEPTWQGDYIWYPNERVDNVTRYFRRHFNIASVKDLVSATIQVAADDTWTGYCNGRTFGKGGVPAKSFDLLPFLRSGKNVLAFQVNEFSIDEGLLIELTMRRKNGPPQTVITDASWLVSREAPGEWWQPEYNDSGWVAAMANGRSKNGVQFQPENRRPAGLKWSSINLPSEVKPGEKITAKITFSCQLDMNEDWGFRFTIGETPMVVTADFRVAEAEIIPAPGTSTWKSGKE